MVYLKLIFYGLLAFVTRHPVFCIVLGVLLYFFPAVVGWTLLGILALILLVFGFLGWKMYKLKRDMKRRFDEATGGNANFGGAQGFGGANFGGFAMGGMSLEELVRQMQAQADAHQRARQGRGSNSGTSTSGSAQKRVNDKVGDYVDFEEVE
jgi:energy-coupling factor transporter transmembrane protein EcfT